MTEIRFDFLFNKSWEKNLSKIAKYLKKNSDVFKMQVKDNYFCLVSSCNVILIPILEPKEEEFVIEKILDVDSNSLLVKKLDEESCIIINHLLDPLRLAEEKVATYFPSSKEKALHLSRLAYKISKTFNLIVNIENLEKIYIPLFDSIQGTHEIIIKASIIKNRDGKIEHAFFTFENEKNIKFISAAILPDD